MPPLLISKEDKIFYCVHIWEIFLFYLHSRGKFDTIQWNILRKKKYFWKKISIFFIIFGLWAKNFLIFVKKLSAGLLKLHSKCTEENFDERKFLIEKNYIFFNYFWTLSEKFSKFYRQKHHTLMMEKTFLRHNINWYAFYSKIAAVSDFEKNSIFS